MVALPRPAVLFGRLLTILALLCASSPAVGQARASDEDEVARRHAMDKRLHSVAHVEHFFSEGNWDILGPPLTDGEDAIDWIAGQPWSNGEVGLVGCSSTAEWQMAVASRAPTCPSTCRPSGTCRGTTCRWGRTWRSSTTRVRSRRRRWRTSSTP